MEITKKLGKKIFKERKLREVTQEEFANEIGMSLSYYRKIEKGTANMSVRSLERIANGFGMKPDELLNFDDIE